MKSKKFIRSNPHLPVKNLRETLGCYREVLGFYDEWTWIDKNGQETDGASGGTICACFLAKPLTG